MVEVTNYIYLAILVCLQYLGVQHETYQFTIDFSKEEGYEQRASAIFDFNQLEIQDDKWMIISPDKKHKVPITIVKDSVIDYESGIAKTTKFTEINFNRLTKQKDTIFNKKNVAVAAIIKNNKSIKFIILEHSFYDQITMTITE